MSYSLIRSAFNTGSMTFISRVLGFTRDIIIARLFGAGVGADAFFVAFKVPNFLRRLFAEGAFSQSFVPVISEYKTQRDHTEVQNLVNHVTGSLGSLLFLVTAIGMLTAPLLIWLFAPGFGDDSEKFTLATQMLRITFPYLFFISLTALAAGILNTYGHFAAPAFTPVFLNLSLITAALASSYYFDHSIVVLAWGVFIAGIIQLGFQLPFLKKIHLLPRPTFNFKDPGVKRIGQLMLPALFGSSVVQINLLLDTLIASFLVTGSISWLYYSNRLVEFPLGVFGIALSTVVLPKLSTHFSDASPQAFSNTVDWALRWVFLIAPAATLGLFFLAGPILTTLFEYGKFNAQDSIFASYSLMAYSLGLTAFILIKVLSTAFFSRQDTKTPVKIGIIAVVCNIGLNIALVFPLQHAGLALATSLSACINAGLLFYFLKKKAIYNYLPGWRNWISKILLANMMMGGLLFFGLPDMSLWQTWAWFERLWHLSFWIGAASFIYVAALFIAGMRLHDITRTP